MENSTVSTAINWDEVETLRFSSQLGEDLIHKTGVSMAGEQYRLIRTRIVHHVSAPKTLLISSPGVGDGKSTTAINLAYVLALREGARTLLVDGDLRRSSVGPLLGIKGRAGLADVLRGGCTPGKGILSCEQNPKLHIMTSGLQRRNVTELLDSNHLGRFMQMAREAFDYVVVDAPPINSVADYELLQNSVDGVVVIIRPEHTDRGLCARALRAVPSESLIGVVINCARDWPFWKTPQSYYDYARTSPE